MIFLVFCAFQSIFAQKNTHKIVSDSDGFAEKILDAERVFGQLRFNATCDELSLDLAAQCETRLRIEYTILYDPYRLINILCHLAA